MRPEAIGLGVREGSLRVSEELTLDQLLGNRRAVDGNEGPVLSTAAGVKRSCHQLFARTQIHR